MNTTSNPRESIKRVLSESNSLDSEHPYVPSPRQIEAVAQLVIEELNKFDEALHARNSSWRQMTLYVEARRKAYEGTPND